MLNDIFELKKFDWDGSIPGEDFGWFKMWKVTFMEVGAILCVVKGISSEWNAVRKPRKPQRVFDLSKQSNCAMKVLMSIIKTGIGMAGICPWYEFLKLVLYECPYWSFYSFASLNTVKILSLTVYCARAVRNFWLWKNKSVNFVCNDLIEY